jgi:hypothetical protein
MSTPALALIEAASGTQGAIWRYQNLFVELTQPAVVAKAGGGQSGATQITGQTVRVSTVATANDSVQLMGAIPGLEVMLINDGANPVQVFGNGTDTIDGQAAATGVSQMQNSLVIYTCAVAGSWRSEGLATGFGGPGLQTVSAQDALTAKAGGGQGGGPTINRMVNRFTTVASGNDSCTLPATTGIANGVCLQITIINGAASNSMNVFPATGDQINALGANNAFALAANKTASFFSTVAGQWHSTLTA